MIRLLLVDDQSLICHGLKAILELEPDLKVIGMANNGKEAIEQVAKLQPDLVLMDIRMPVMDGRAATREICKRFPEIKIIVLSTFDDDEYITDAMLAGAKGYLLKDMPSEELIQAIRLACRGYAQLGPGLLDRLMANVSVNDESGVETTSEKLHSVTPREQEVLYLISSGATNREIAQQLYISEGTVKTHVTHLLTRLNLRNRAQLAIYSNSIFKG